MSRTVAQFQYVRDPRRSKLVPFRWPDPPAAAAAAAAAAAGTILLLNSAAAFIQGCTVI